MFKNLAGNSSIRIGSLVTMVFSVVMSAVILWIIPIACTFVGSIQLVLLGMMFLAAVVTLGLQWLLSIRYRRTSQT